MALISLNIEQARQTAGIFDRSSNELDNLCGYLQQQWSALAATWEGHSKHATEGEVRAVLNRCGQVAQLTKERGVKLTQIADRFQAADENVAYVVQAMVWASLGTGGTLAAPGFIEDRLADLRDTFRVFFPYDVKEGMEYLKELSAGQDIIAQAKEAKITFKLPNGERVGYEGDDGQVIEIKMGSSVGGGHYGDNVIVISDDVFGRADSKASLAARLAHEMQHAYDAKTGRMHGLTQESELKSYFDLSPEKQQEARTRLANNLETNIDSEIRAYERADAVTKGQSYQDDGVMTHDERQAVLKRNLDFTVNYEGYYERELGKLYPGTEFDVWLDNQGEVQINITKPAIFPVGYPSQPI
jgi:WXG100 family type VII secretion target